MNNFPCVNSMLLNQHLAEYDDHYAFQAWLCEYEMTQRDFINVIESLLDKNELFVLHNAIQHILENGLEAGQLAELKSLIDNDRCDKLHYIAAYVDEMDADQLASALVIAYQCKKTVKNYLLTDLDGAVIHYIDNEPSLYQKYQDEMEARHNEC